MSKAFYLLSYLLRLSIADSRGQCDMLFTNPGLLSVEDWYDTYHLAVKHMVVALAWDGVVHMQTHFPRNQQNLPAELVGKWFADVQTIETANKRLVQQTAHLREFLRMGGFDSQLLKGASFAAYYHNPLHRQSSDIDLWVLPKPGQKLSDHRQALIAYLHEKDIPIGEVVYHHIEANISPDFNIELHVTPTWLYNPIYNDRLQQLFAIQRQFTPELQELYALLHAFRHVWHDGLALRHVMDYYLICRNNRQNGVIAPDSIYSQLGLMSFGQAMDEMAEFCFNGNAAKPFSVESFSPAVRHLLQALPYRDVTCAIQRDYLQETLFSLPWRAVHVSWRRWHNFN